MSHEHSGECCGRQSQPVAQHMHEHEGHNHTHDVPHAIGSLCCKGMCSHPEHIAVGHDQLRAQLNMLHEQEDDDEEETDEYGNKKKKPSTRWLLPVGARKGSIIWQILGM